MVAWPAAATAIPLGIAFGVILERVGLGDSRVIGAQLSGRNFTVVRVMFGAIVTAMLGVVWLGKAGLIDPTAIAMPPTDAAAQALGAVVFGGGFALAALCPGTACVAASSGRRDGLAAVVGMFVGTALTPAVWPSLGTVAARVPRENARLPEDLGLPLWVVVLAVTLAGVAAAMIARRVERSNVGGRPWWHVTRAESVALTLAVGFALVRDQATVPRPLLASFAGQIARDEDRVEPLDLATWIRDGRRGLRVIDVRDGLDTTIYRIPGAESVPLERIAGLEVRSGEHLVLYGDGSTRAGQAWVLLRARGLSDVQILTDGMIGWEAEVLSPITPAPAADDSTRQRFERARGMSYWYGGRPAAGPSSGSARESAAPRKRRRNRC